ncbi:MAG: class I SAM-dependent methyltransferase [Patescibacteria group bacterium]|jgi:SAM-dependent methyltransferase
MKKIETLLDQFGTTMSYRQLVAELEDADETTRATVLVAVAQKQADFWAESAEYYQEAHPRLPGMKAHNKWVLKAVDAIPGDRVLDIGCGCGRFAPMFHRGIQYMGVDPSAAMFEIARREHTGDNIHFLQWPDNTKLPFGDGYFDIVLANWSIVYMEPNKLQATLFDLRRVIRPGGRFVLTAIVANARWGWLATVRSTFSNPLETWRQRDAIRQAIPFGRSIGLLFPSYMEWELDGLVTQAGLRIVATQHTLWGRSYGIVAKRLSQPP